MTIDTFNPTSIENEDFDGCFFCDDGWDGPPFSLSIFTDSSDSTYVQIISA